MGKSSCFVPGCRTGYTSDRKSCKTQGRKCCSLFTSPRDEQLFEKWKRIIPRADKELTKKDVVCELHFSEDDVVRHFCTKMPNGTIDKIPRGLPSLRKGAIPIKFPNLPSCYSKLALRYKERAIRVLLSKQVKAKKSNSGKLTVPDTNLDFCQFENHPTLSSNEHFSFNDLLEVINFIKAPSEWWSVTCVQNFIVCQKWNNLYAVEKKVVVKNDMNVIAFIRDHQINLRDLENVSDVQDVSVILQKIDEIVEHAGIENGFPAKETCSSQSIMANTMPSNTSLCSDHFAEDQFDRSSWLKVQLQDNAVPTVVKGFRNYLRKKPALESKKVNFNKPIQNTEESIDILQETSDLPFISGSTNISEDQIPENITICNEAIECQLSNKESTDNESTSDSEEEIHDKLPDNTFYISNSSYTSSNAKELVKRKLENVTAHYEKAQKKMKLYQRKCELHKRQITVLEEVMSNLQQINSISDEL